MKPVAQSHGSPKRPMVNTCGRQLVEQEDKGAGPLYYCPLQSCRFHQPDLTDSGSWKGWPRPRNVLVHVRQEKKRDDRHGHLPALCTSLTLPKYATATARKEARRASDRKHRTDQQARARWSKVCEEAVNR